MSKYSVAFLKAVLTNPGYQALAKTADRVPALWKVFVPRTVLGYLESANQVSVPVVGGSLTKSATGWSGTVGTQPVTNATTAEAAAVITLQLGFDPVDLRVTNNQIQRLGKHIDAMLHATLRKGGVDLPGQTAKPQPQLGPQGPEAPSTKQIKPKLPKPLLPKKAGIVKAIKVEVAKAEAGCSECGGHGFRNHRYVGCVCWSALSKSIHTEAYGDGYVLDCSKLDDEEFLAFREGFNG